MTISKQSTVKPMAIGPAATGLLMAALFIMGLGSLSAQDSGQRLRWIGDEYTLRYEVIIEREKEGKYDRVLREFTETNFINVSLLPGRYRCRIIPYDFLDQPLPVTEWIGFEVLADNRNSETGKDGTNVVSPNDETGRATIVLATPQAERQVEPLPEKPAVLPPEFTPTPGKGPDPARFWTIGASIGSAFAAPWVTATVRGTIAPFRYSFLELGADMGLAVGTPDVGYFSLYPYAHYALFLPFADAGGLYAGAGGGLMFVSYTFSEGNYWEIIPLVALSVGVNLLDCIDISYTLRASTARTGHKVSVGYTYRFK